MLAAMGAREGSSPPPAGAVVVRAGSRARLPGRGLIVTEGGDRRDCDGRLPAGLEPGYHRFLGGDRELPLIVAPARCYLPPSLTGFGLAVQLYAARSAASWGIGDLGDLRSLGAWARRLGARMLLVNPLHAPLPALPQDPSPYYPSSRRFRNPLYIRVEEVPGAPAAGAAVERAARAARRLNRDRLIDHSRVYELKLRALRAVFRTSGDDRRFDAFVREQGAALQDYATFCAIAEVHGRPWQRWPEELRHPRTAGVARFRRARRRAVRFHQWLQWLLDLQLAAAGGEIALMNDLAIGVHPDGADAWLYQDVLAEGFSVGAPPDPFQASGQDWGLPPFDPWKLRAAGFAPFAETVRAALRHAGSLRIDHVMGLFRLYWIPIGEGAEAGVYVRYPHRELLAVLALESSRARAYIVGEDLGTVEDGVRHELLARRVLSYRLLWFEDRPPSDYPRQAMAAVTTHDLATVAGVWEGSDSDPAIRERLLRVTGLDPGAATDDAVLAAYQALARAPSRLLSATLEDLLSVPERPNQPGTVDEWPNWRLALPAPLEELFRDPRPRRIARALSRRR